MYRVRARRVGVDLQRARAEPAKAVWPSQRQHVASETHSLPRLDAHDRMDVAAVRLQKDYVTALRGKQRVYFNRIQHASSRVHSPRLPQARRATTEIREVAATRPATRCLRERVREHHHIKVPQCFLLKVHFWGVYGVRVAYVTSLTGLGAKNAQKCIVYMCMVCASCGGFSFVW